MGERKGVNKYYPPDWDPSQGNLDKYHGVHPLRERAAKLHLGILVIRFEMPFNMWCGGCNNHIGMGVRYNAEKKKIGMYYTTPLWQFRMKCHLCPNYIEMHTDPKNFDYIVASGGHRKEERYNQEDAECAAAHEPEERKKLRTDPMFKLQYQQEDKEVLEEAGPMMDKLEDLQRVWRDDYAVNKALRKKHREDTVSDKRANSILKKQVGLDVKMLPTAKSDTLTSSLVRFTTKKDGLKLQKKSEISAIFCDKRTSLLTSLKSSGLKCRRSEPGPSPDITSLVRGKKRRRSEDSACSSSTTSSSSSTISLKRMMIKNSPVDAGNPVNLSTASDSRCTATVASSNDGVICKTPDQKSACGSKSLVELSPIQPPNPDELQGREEVQDRNDILQTSSSDNIADVIASDFTGDSITSDAHDVTNFNSGSDQVVSGTFGLCEVEQKKNLSLVSGYSSSDSSDS